MTIRTEDEFTVCVAAWFGLQDKANPTAEDLVEIAELEFNIDDYERQHPISTPERATGLPSSGTPH